MTETARCKIEEAKRLLEKAHDVMSEAILAEVDAGYKSDYHDAQAEIISARQSLDAFYTDRAIEAPRKVSAPALRGVLMDRYPRTVRKFGVRFQGAHYGGQDPQIQKHLGQRVSIAVNPNDLSYVLVLTPKGNIIGRANRNAMLPVAYTKSLATQGG